MASPRFGLIGWAISCFLNVRWTGVFIPTRVEQDPDLTFDRAAYRERTVGEPFIYSLKR